MNSQDLMLAMAIQKAHGGGGGDITVESLSVTSNNTYTAPTGKAYSPVTVDVQPELQEKTVYENGVVTADLGYDGLSKVTVSVPEPSGTINISQNGTVNVKDYASAVVNVAGADDPFALTDYIESSGTQYINTDYYVTINTRLEAVANLPNTSTAKQLFGTREVVSAEANAKGCLLYPGGAGSNAATVYAQFGGFQDNWTSIMSNYFGVKAIYRLSKGRFGIIADWNSNGQGVSYSYAPTTAYPLYLLALNNAGSPLINAGSAKLYRFRIYEGDTLVQELVPWTDENDVVCLKDTVTGNLKYNAGTGVFTRWTDT